MEASTMFDTTPLRHFIEHSYLETLRRITEFLEMIGADVA